MILELLAVIGLGGIGGALTIGTVEGVKLAFLRLFT